jgi:hypothetical protein
VLPPAIFPLTKCLLGITTVLLERTIGERGIVILPHLQKRT